MTISCCCRMQIAVYIISITELVISLISAIFWTYTLAANESPYNKGGDGYELRVAFLVVSVVNILFATLLLVGAYRRRHQLVLFWVVINGIVLSVSTFGCIGLFFIIISALPNRDIPLPVVSIPILLILVKLYAWFLTYTFYKELKKEHSEKRTSLKYKFKLRTLAEFVTDYENRKEVALLISIPILFIVLKMYGWVVTYKFYRQELKKLHTENNSSSSHDDLSTEMR